MDRSPPRPVVLIRKASGAIGTTRGEGIQGLEPERTAGSSMCAYSRVQHGHAEPVRRVPRTSRINGGYIPSALS